MKLKGSTLFKQTLTEYSIQPLDKKFNILNLTLVAADAFGGQVMRIFHFSFLVHMCNT